MASQEPTDDELLLKVQKWLETQGYPLEFRTASTLTKAGFRTQQGQYTKGTEKPCEIDVLATIDSQGSPRIVRVVHVVECKWSTDKPWVIFSTHRHIHPLSIVGNCIASGAAKVLFESEPAAIDGRELVTLAFFEPVAREGFGGSQALGDRKEGQQDLFFKAVQKVVLAAHSEASSYDGPPTTRAACVIALPMIVVQGALFEAYFDEQTRELKTERVDQARLVWRGSEAVRRPVVVDIFAFDTLASHAKVRFQHSMRLVELLDQAFKARFGN